MIEARYICERLTRYFGKRKLSQDSLSGFITQRRGEEVKARTINTNLAILRAVLNNAVEAELSKEVSLTGIPYLH